MSQLDTIAPTTKDRVIDLVSNAGIDVSDWANFKGGPSKASVNPRYCYEWSFIKPSKFVLLNLWHNKNRFESGRILQTNNFRTDAEAATKRGKGTWSRRAKKIDDAIQMAVRENLPVRVILLDGKIKNMDAENPVASQVEMRELDPDLWTIVEYDYATGQNTIARGVLDGDYVDQFSLDQFNKGNPDRRKKTVSVYERDPQVRRQALVRANGACQYCKQRGFMMENGAIYLETHHILPLSEGGSDSLGNIIALCPNDHKQAHYGLNQDDLRTTLLTIIGKP